MSEPVKVLIVDDEEIVRESLCGWLRNDGTSSGWRRTGRQRWRC